MNELNLELFCTDKQKEIVDGKSIADRAEIKHWPDYLIAKGIHRFPDYLSIEQISDLLFPFPQPEYIFMSRSCRLKKYCPKFEQNNLYRDTLIDACKNGALSYEGNISGWEYNKNNPFPLALQGDHIVSFSDPNANNIDRYRCNPSDCTIHKNEFKRYFKSIDQWPLVNKGLLAGWWVDNPGGKSEPPATKAQKETDNLNPYSDFELKGVDLQNANNILGRNPRIIDKYLVCLWITSGMNDNKYFYPSLKKHTRHKVAGSPIEEWSLLQIQHSSGKPIKKKTIGTKISQWKNTVKS